MVFLQKYRLKTTVEYLEHVFNFIIPFSFFPPHTVCIILNVICSFLIVCTQNILTGHNIKWLNADYLRFRLTSSIRKSVTSIGHQRAV